MTPIDFNNLDYTKLPTVSNFNADKIMNGDIKVNTLAATMDKMVTAHVSNVAFDESYNVYYISCEVSTEDYLKYDNPEAITHSIVKASFVLLIVHSSALELETDEYFAAMQPDNCNLTTITTGYKA